MALSISPGSSAQVGPLRYGCMNQGNCFGRDFVTCIGALQDDFMLFPGDAVFSYVEQARNNAKNNRVYVLKIAQNNQVPDLNPF
jgi:hypothetical protein